jgi:hypothetical protein
VAVEVVPVVVGVPVLVPVVVPVPVVLPDAVVVLPVEVLVPVAPPVAVPVVDPVVAPVVTPVDVGPPVVGSTNTPEPVSVTDFDPLQARIESKLTRQAIRIMTPSQSVDGCG